jgi:hypothetical protein
MIEPVTLESQLAYIKEEVDALKTAQPFYNGQFKPYRRETVAAYDHEFSLPSGNSVLNMFLQFHTLTQAHALGRVFFRFYDSSGVEFPAYTFRTSRSLRLADTDYYLYFYDQFICTFASPTTVRVKYSLLVSDEVSLSFQEWTVS